MNAKTGLRLAGAAAAFTMLAACQPRVASMDCDDIAREAQRIWRDSPNQPVRVTEIRSPREVSRNEREARCTAEATWSDQSVSNINLRAFQTENGSVMVESGTQAFQ
jgi:hypothetical protein